MFLERNQWCHYSAYIFVIIQKKVVPTPDYESIDETVIQPKAESPGADMEDDMGIYLLVLHKNDFAIHYLYLQSFDLI